MKLVWVGQVRGLYANKNTAFYLTQFSRYHLMALASAFVTPFSVFLITKHARLFLNNNISLILKDFEFYSIVPGKF